MNFTGLELVIRLLNESCLAQFKESTIPYLYCVLTLGNCYLELMKVFLC